MAEKELIMHTKTCPNCGSKISFSEQDSYVTCPACDSEFSTEELLSSNKLSGNAANAELAVAAIDSGESGLAYLDSIFETMDWEDFALNSPSLSVFVIDKVVDKIKIKSANKPDTWLFEFKSIAIPLLHKIEALSGLEKEIDEGYTGGDDTELLSKFDSYKSIVSKILEEKETIIKRLEIDVKFLEKFKADGKTINECKSDLEAIKSKVAKLRLDTTMYEMDVIQKKIGAMEKELVSRLSAEGIDVVQTYHDAINAYLSGNKKQALDSFNKIIEYRDSASYVQRLESSAVFDDDIFIFNGTTYIVDKCVVAEEPDKKKKKSVTQNFISGGTGLFEIVDGIKRNKAVVGSIKDPLVTYTSKLFFVNTKDELAMFDFETKETTVLCKATNCADFNIHGNFKVYKELGKAVFLGPNIVEEKKGCLKKKGKEEEGKAFPTYCLDVLNLATGTIETIDKEVTRFEDSYGPNIFYEKSIDKEGTKFEHKFFAVEDSRVLTPFSREVFVQDVVDGNIVYSLWEPDINNLDLHVLNTYTSEDHLIEKNVYDYFGTVDGKIYYTVGSFRYLPLYRCNYDGSEIQEVATNCEKVVGELNGYMYIVRGWGYNKSLIKMKNDGTNRTFICSNFKQVIEFKNGYIYYKDNGNGFGRGRKVKSNLHIVRCDGKEDRVIAENLERVYKITDTKIFFSRTETFDEDATTVVKSLYYMDLNGHNLHKIVYDFEKALSVDDNTIMYCKRDIVEFDVTNADEKGEYKNSIRQKFPVMAYYSINVNNLELTRVLLRGVPEFGALVAKKGCLKKKEVKYPPKVLRVEYIYPNPFRLINDEDDDEDDEDAEQFVPDTSKKGAGCGTKNKAASNKGAGCGAKNNAAPATKAKGCGAK